MVETIREIELRRVEYMHGLADVFDREAAPVFEAIAARLAAELNLQEAADG